VNRIAVFQIGSLHLESNCQNGSNHDLNPNCDWDLPITGVMCETLYSVDIRTCSRWEWAARPASWDAEITSSSVIRDAAADCHAAAEPQVTALLSLLSVFCLLVADILYDNDEQMLQCYTDRGLLYIYSCVFTCPIFL